MAEYPTEWQKKTIWNCVTALALFVTLALVVFLIWLGGQALSFLQPLLIPVAVAGVMAFLLEPVVRFLCSRGGLSRLRAVVAVFLLVTLLIVSIFFWVAPAIYRQSINLAGKLPGYTQTVKQQVSDFATANSERFGLTEVPLLGDLLDRMGRNKDSDTADGDDGGSQVAAESEGAAAESESSPPAPGTDLGPLLTEIVHWVQGELPGLANGTIEVLRKSVGGFLGAFGFLLSMILVPVYLFFFLKESPKISSEWSRYLPLRASKFKDEVVGTLSEINGYLINFFRGQLVVSMIDGALTGIGLLILGLDFALLIGLMVAVLGLIPFIGILLCWLPAVLIALVQWPGEWLQPVLVTVIFIVVQQLEGLLISPKIVGDSVGLHPMTVIASMVAWSLLFGGLLGAILAVPLTATCKVLLKRFVWERSGQSVPALAPQGASDSDPPPDEAGEEDDADGGESR